MQLSNHGNEEELEGEDAQGQSAFPVLDDADAPFCEKAHRLGSGRMSSNPVHRCRNKTLTDLT